MRAFGPVAAPIDTDALSDIPPDLLHPDPSTRPHLMQLGTLRLPFKVRQQISFNASGLSLSMASAMRHGSFGL